jgi:hypothetical protein
MRRVCFLIFCASCQSVDKGIITHSGPAGEFPAFAVDDQSETTAVEAQGDDGGFRVIVGFNDGTWSVLPSGQPDIFEENGVLMCRRGYSMMGVAVSKDAGSTWLYKGKLASFDSELFPISSIQGDPSIAVDPVHPEVVYYTQMASSNESWNAKTTAFEVPCNDSDSLAGVDSICVGRSLNGGDSFISHNCFSAVPNPFKASEVPVGGDAIDHTAVAVDGKGCPWFAWVEIISATKKPITRVATFIPDSDGNCDPHILAWPPSLVDMSPRGLSPTPITCNDTNGAVGCCGVDPENENKDALFFCENGQAKHLSCEKNCGWDVNKKAFGCVAGEPLPDLTGEHSILCGRDDVSILPGEIYPRLSTDRYGNILISTFSQVVNPDNNQPSGVVKTRLYSPYQQKFIQGSFISPGCKYLSTSLISGNPSPQITPSKFAKTGFPYDVAGGLASDFSYRIRASIQVSGSGNLGLPTIGLANVERNVTTGECSEPIGWVLPTVPGRSSFQPTITTYRTSDGFNDWMLGFLTNNESTGVNESFVAVGAWPLSVATKTIEGASYLKAFLGAPYVRVTPANNFVCIAENYYFGDYWGMTPIHDKDGSLSFLGAFSRSSIGVTNCVPSFSKPMHIGVATWF